MCVVVGALPYLKGGEKTCYRKSKSLKRQFLRHFKQVVTVLFPLSHINYPFLSICNTLKFKDKI